ncbi:hypothetical protein Tco_1015726 [Tanacetum coccineum]|uniref:Uncharacterized protein n=1 Tax=Tanacetum coccineum TaxID=301880 RepID=A0ABQ5FLQ8_9ASTR
MAPSPEGVASPHNQVESSPEGNGTLPFTHAGGNPYRPRQDSNMRPCLGGVIHFQFHLRTPKVSSMMASIDKDVEKSSLADQDDVKASTPHSEDPMDINKMTDTLEPEENQETGVGGLQLPGKYRVVFRPSERITISVVHFQFHLRTPKVSSMMASIDEDVEKSSLADQDDVGSGVSSKSITEEEWSARNASTSQSEVGLSQGDIVMKGIIESVQNRHLVMEETTEIMIIKEADMKVQGELLATVLYCRSEWSSDVFG